jgi:hypothetical protein
MISHTNRRITMPKKLYGFLVDDPSSMPWPNMTAGEMVEFVRTRSDECRWPMVVVGGPIRGANVNITAANYERVKKRAALPYADYNAFVAAQIAMMELAFEEGRLTRDKVINPVTVRTSERAA